MKIIQASCYYPPHVGGVENHVMELSNALARRGNELLVATSDILDGENNGCNGDCVRFKSKEIVPGYVPFIFGLSKTIRARRKKNVLFVGRLVQPKGIEYLIRAMPQVLREIPEAKLVVIGEGEELRNLTNLARKLDLKNKVEFRGFVKFKELVKSYLEASVLVLPSFTRLENFGIVLLEAMACKTPVVASDILGVRENIHNGNSNGNGLLFPPKDVDKLADSIIRILSDEKKVRRMGEAGRKLVKEKYDWKMIAEQVSKLYDKL